MAQRSLVLRSRSQSLRRIDRHPRQAVVERVPERPLWRLRAHCLVAPISTEQPQALSCWSHRERDPGATPERARSVLGWAFGSPVEPPLRCCRSHLALCLRHRCVHRVHNRRAVDHGTLRISFPTGAGVLCSVAICTPIDTQDALRDQGVSVQSPQDSQGFTWLTGNADHAQRFLG